MKNLNIKVEFKSILFRRVTFIKPKKEYKYFPKKTKYSLAYSVYNWDVRQAERISLFYICIMYIVNLFPHPLPIHSMLVYIQIHIYTQRNPIYEYMRRQTFQRAVGAYGIIEKKEPK